MVGEEVVDGDNVVGFVFRRSGSGRARLRPGPVTERHVALRSEKQEKLGILEAGGGGRGGDWRV